MDFRHLPQHLLRRQQPHGVGIQNPQRRDMGEDQPAAQHLVPILHI